MVPRKVSAVRPQEMLCSEFPMVSVSVSSLSHSQRMLLAYCKGAKEVWGVRKPCAISENRLAFKVSLSGKRKQLTEISKALGY